MADDTLQIEVVYACPEQQWLFDLIVSQGTTVEQAITASGLLTQCPELDLTSLTVGLFGQVCPLNTVLSCDTRVEIYRPLQQDPMTARRNRVQ